MPRPVGFTTEWRLRFAMARRGWRFPARTPLLLSGQDTQKVARANRARSAAYKPALELIVGFDINWSIVSFATPAWAKTVFPDDPPEVALARLWDAIFKGVPRRWT